MQLPDKIKRLSFTMRRQKHTLQGVHTCVGVCTKHIYGKFLFLINIHIIRSSFDHSIGGETQIKENGANIDKMRTE